MILFIVNLILSLHIGCSGILFGKSVDILDKSTEGGLELIEPIAQIICAQRGGGNSNKQISRVSTVKLLLEYFNNSKESSSKLAECGKHLGPILRELIDLIDVSNDNVCSDAKVSRIEEFHRKYVSTANLDVANRADTRNKLALPEIIKLFFMHYAIETSASCKINLINNLEWDAKTKVSEEDQQLGRSGLIDEIIATLGDGHSLDQVSDYDDIVLLWDLIPEWNPNKESNMRLEKEAIDPVTGEPVNVFIKVQQPHRMRTIQALCRNKLKPIYSKLIMPIIRLANSGYSCNGDRFAREIAELKKNELVKRWYGITQICEAILPIKFYADRELNVQDMVIILEDEAHKIDQEQPEQNELLEIEKEPKIEYEPTTNLPTFADALPSVEVDEVQSLIKRIKLSLTNRDRAIVRLLKRVGRIIERLVKSKISSIFFSRKREEVATTNNNNNSTQSTGKDEFEKRDMRPVLNRLANYTNEELMKLKGSVARNKRRERAGDRDHQYSYEQETLSYMHTRTKQEILLSLEKGLEKMLPSRTWMLVIGNIVTLVLGIIFACMILSLVG